MEGVETAPSHVELGFFQVFLSELARGRALQSFDGLVHAFFFKHR